MRKKICIISSGHSLFDNRVFEKEAKNLKKAGYEVHIISLAPKPIDEIKDGIFVHGLQSWGFSYAKNKILAYWRFITYFPKLIMKALRVDASIYQCLEPEMLFVGLFLKLLKGKPYTYDIHEDFSDLRFRRNKKGLINKILYLMHNKIEKLLSIPASGLITVNRSLRNSFLTYNKNIEIILNVPKLIKLSKVNTDKYIGKNVVIYTSSNFDSDKGLFKFLEVLPIVKKKINDIFFLLAGYVKSSQRKIIKSWLDNFNKKYNLNNFYEITGKISHNRVIELISISKIGVILFQPSHRNNLIGLPNKLFDYMAYGIPVIASNFVEISKIVREAKCGLLVDPTDILEIADAMVYLLKHPREAKEMGLNGKKAVLEKYNWEIEERKLVNFYDRILNL